MGNCHSKTGEEDFEGSWRVLDIHKCSKAASSAPRGSPPAYSVQTQRFMFYIKAVGTGRRQITWLPIRGLCHQQQPPEL